MNLYLLKQDKLHCKFAIVHEHFNELCFMLYLCNINKLKF
jgi:hypothetical protein